MGILILRAVPNHRPGAPVSQSPKAGYGYSNSNHETTSLSQEVSRLNPLKRVMGILIGFSVIETAVPVPLSQSPKAGHGYSNNA